MQLVVVALLAAVANGVPVVLDNLDNFMKTPIKHVDYRNTTCGRECDTYCLRDDCPINVLTFETRYHAIFPNGTQSKKDFEEHTHVVSNIGSPSVVVGYCGWRADCQLSLSDVTSPQNFWVHALQNLQNMREVSQGQPFERNMDLLAFAKDSGGSATNGLDVFSIGLQFQELIEFTDENGDNRFSPDVDRVVQRMDLGTVKWRPATYDERQAPGTAANPTTLYQWNMTSVDGRITMRFETSSYPDAPLPNPIFPSMADPQIRNPNATRVVVGFTNLTYANPDGRSRLALKTFLITPNDDVAFADLVGRRVLLVDKHTNHKLGYLSYTPMALANPGAGPEAGELKAHRVTASPLHEVQDSREIGYSLARSLRVESTSSEARVMYFTFAGGAFQPSEVYWDVAVGVGGFPVRSRQVFWAGAVTLSLVIAGLLLVITNRKALMSGLLHGIGSKRKEAAIKRLKEYRAKERLQRDQTEYKDEEVDAFRHPGEDEEEDESATLLGK